MISAIDVKPLVLAELPLQVMEVAEGVAAEVAEVVTVVIVVAVAVVVAVATVVIAAVVIAAVVAVMEDVIVAAAGRLGVIEIGTGTEDADGTVGAAAADGDNDF